MVLGPQNFLQINYYYFEVVPFRQKESELCKVEKLQSSKSYEVEKATVPRGDISYLGLYYIHKFSSAVTKFTTIP